MGLAGIDLLLTIPFSTFGLYTNITTGVSPWISWSNTHLDFSRVGQYPAVVWKQDSLSVVSFELTRWGSIMCAVIFFAFFGFADEARKNYRLAFDSVAKRVGYTTGTMFSNMSSSFGSKQALSSTARGTLPVYIKQESVSKHDSFISFSTNLTLGDGGGALDDKLSHSPSSRYSYDEKRPLPPISSPEPALDPASAPRHFTDESARPDSMTIV